jgi:hypothetical protein
LGQFLEHHVLVEKLQEKTAMLSECENKLWLLRQSHSRKVLRVRSLKDELNEKALRGDVKALVENINSIMRNGQDEKRKALLPFVYDIVNSAAKRNVSTDAGHKGIRWKETSKQLLAVLKKKGGRSQFIFVLNTLSSAADSTVMAQWNKDKVRLDLGEHLVNFVQAGEIYSGLMEQKKIVGPVPYEIQEDEEFIECHFSWDPHRDITVGTCGKRSDDHQCDANYAHQRLGSGVEAYHRIEGDAVHGQRASYLRGCLVVPLHPDLPAIPVVVHPTCLRFDADWVGNSWKRIDDFCAIAFAETLGPVPQGHGADGASTRFRKMKDRMRIPPGPGRFSLAAPGLLITGREVEVGGVTCVTDLDSQDPRHDLGKMFGPLDSPIRDFFVGDEPASHFDNIETARLADAAGDKHGAIKRHLDRRDAQSKTAPSVMTANDFRRCMRRAIDGGYGAKQPFEGTLAWANIMHRFLLVFFSKKETGLDRAKSAGFVQGMLRRMRWHIVDTPGRTLKVNFLPAPTYEHVLHAVMVAPLKLKAWRVQHNHLPEHLEETGSNAVEKLWSSTSGFGAIRSGQRGHDAAEAQRRIEDQITLIKYEAADTGLNFGEENRTTQRDIKIPLHEDGEASDADPLHHYEDDELIAAWDAGDDEAKDAAEGLGMKPSPIKDWWDEPWLEEERHILDMRPADDEASPPPATAASGGGEDGGGGGGDDGSGGVGGRAGREFAAALVALAARESNREKTDPLVELPGEPPRSKAYKRTVVNEFNKDVDTKISAERLSRIKLSSKQIADIDAAQAAKAAAVAAAAQGGGGGGGDGGGGGVGAAAAAAAAVDPSAASEAGSDGYERNEASMGSDIAFAMAEGPASSPTHRWWIGRVCKLFKGKAQYRGSISLNEELPSDMFAVCEWYSAMSGSENLKFHFRKLSDRTKYPFANCIGTVLINIDDSDSSAEDTYTITTEMRDSLDEGLKMTTPVKSGSKTTHGTKKRKQQQQQEEADETAERMARPRVNLMRPSSRAASRGNSSSSSSSSTSSSSASSSSVSTTPSSS